MHASDLKDVIDNQLTQCEDILDSKNRGYSSENDALHAFKAPAAFRDQLPRQALGGMMMKHTVSIYDLIEQHEPTSIEVWNEKITDHINYLLLLKALVIEEWQEVEAERERKGFVKTERNDQNTETLERIKAQLSSHTPN